MVAHRAQSGYRLVLLDRHSWHDPVVAKWNALQAWAKRFEAAHAGRSPIVWLDKASQRV